jgi:aspartate ammonia-lyase
MQTGIYHGPQTRQALENFKISDERARPELIRALLLIKAAASQANVDCGVLAPEKAKSIQKATARLLALSEKNLLSYFPIDAFQAGAGTNLNMNVNEVIAELASVHANDDVNRSQSTNDIFPTAMRMSLVDAGRALARELYKCSRVLKRKAQHWWEIPKAARTHLQDAVPMRLGQEARAWSTTFERLAQWIERGQDECRELGLGGSAAGTAINVPRGFKEIALAELSKTTGEKFRPSPDLCEAMQSQSPVAFYSSMLRLMALELTRICNDLRLLGSGPMNGFFELRLPTVQPGSSIMPGKINPSIVEMANQTWFTVLGYDQTVAFAMQAGQLELNVMMPIIAHSLLKATSISTRCLHTLRTRCLEGLEPNITQLNKYYENTPQIATALSPVLGYEVTSELVREALESGKNVMQIVRERKLIPEKKLMELTAPKNALP